MGNRSCRPVISYEEAAERLGGSRLEALRSRFAALTELTKGKLPVGSFVEELTPRFARFGTVLLRRLFQVLDTSGSSWLSLEEFIVGMAVMDAGSKGERLQLIFNLYDLDASGFIKKKQFRQMVMLIIVGASEARWRVPVREESKVVEREVAMEDFDPLVDVMVEAAMELYDSDGDGKLSLSEWAEYADDAEEVQTFLQAMAAK
eukprot:PLAT3294.17.p3 GENE.PLAT3294.17~~PLAT3294.17.p3  ORF type:complete len:229 (-),score=110.09 PLAT3294.17:1803-2414(-)